MYQFFWFGMLKCQSREFRLRCLKKDSIFQNCKQAYLALLSVILVLIVIQEEKLQFFLCKINKSYMTVVIHQGITFLKYGYFCHAVSDFRNKLNIETYMDFSKGCFTHI